MPTIYLLADQFASIYLNCEVNLMPISPPCQNASLTMVDSHARDEE